MDKYDHVGIDNKTMGEIFEVIELEK